MMGWEDIKALFQAALVLLLGQMAWERRNKDRLMHERVLAVEEKIGNIPIEYHGKGTINQIVDGWKEQLEQMREDDQRRHQQNSDTLGRIEDKVGIITAILVRLERTEKDVQDLRDWKHELADPHIRDIVNLERRLTVLEDKR